MLVDKFGCSYDLQRVNVYVGKSDKMGGSWVSWNAMIKKEEYFFSRWRDEDGLRRKMDFALGRIPRV